MKLLCGLAPILLSAIWLAGVPRAESGQACCATGEDKTAWQYFRIVDDEVVDQGVIHVPKPCISRAVSFDAAGNKRDFIIIKYGTGVDPAQAPEFTAGQPFFFAVNPAVGVLSAKQITAGERWGFIIEGRTIEKHHPVDGHQHSFRYSYDFGDTVIDYGDFMLEDGGWLLRECSGDNGEIIGRIAAGGKAVATSELDSEWNLEEFLKVDLPSESGHFYIWPQIPGARCHLWIDEEEYIAIIK